MQNPILTKLIDVFTSDYPNVQAIVLKVSRLEEKATDFWSDYDIQIVLSEKGRISERAFVQTIGNIGTLQGSEKYGFKGDGREDPFRTDRTAAASWKRGRGYLNGKLPGES